MKDVHSESAPRARANLSIPADLLAEAKKLNINLSAAATEGIRTLIKKAREKQWLEENKAAIEAHNEWVRKNGVLITPIWMREDGEI